MKTLVIVESPTKAKTIGQFLGKDFEVVSSMGHIRDLPESTKELKPSQKKQFRGTILGVDIEAGFKPLYVIPESKKRVIEKLKQSLAGADRLFLATDEDREGESISWHLKEVLQPKVPTFRMVFHEITKKALQESLSNLRDINMNLVRAQEARRILDRLVGYGISPVLWRRLGKGLSAGRVQSVAVRLVVEREWERIRFKPTQYLGAKGHFQFKDQKFEAKLIQVGQRRIPTGSDFDHITGDLKTSPDKLLLLTWDQKQELLRNFPVNENEAAHVLEVETKTQHKQVPAPFMTSTLQQAASRAWGWPAKKTMSLAQNLYEKGFITYMRTDSTVLSELAVENARNWVIKIFGKEFLLPEPRYYGEKKAKNAQEAHEAIRPAGEPWLPPEETGLTGDELKLYRLIWNRTLACQMKAAIFENTTYTISWRDGVFKAKGSVIKFRGFLAAYEQDKFDDESNEVEDHQMLPSLTKGQSIQVQAFEVLENQTRPPHRYSEAGLIQKLEKEGIGRPSTYATIMSTIMDRGYIKKVNGQLIPTLSAFFVTQYLMKHLSTIVDVGFTSRMEDSLDEIALGNLDATQFLREFYLGEPEGLARQIELCLKKQDDADFLEFPHLDGYRFHMGRYGPYAVSSSEPQMRISLPFDFMPGQVTPDELNQLKQIQKKQSEPLIFDPKSQKPVFLKKGPYGFYIQVGSDSESIKRIGIPKDMKGEQLTQRAVLNLIELPKSLFQHDGDDVQLRLGPYGLYLSWKGQNFPVPAGADALEWSEHQWRQHWNQLWAKVQETIVGYHPQDGHPILFKKNRFGYFLQWNQKKIPLRKNHLKDSLTLEEALNLIEAHKKSN